MIPKTNISAVLSLAAFLAGTVVVIGAPRHNSLSATAQNKKAKLDPIAWSPANTDAPLASVSATPVCSLPQVVEQAGQRASELVDNLEKFDAIENTRFEETDDFGVATLAVSSKAEYTVDFERKRGALVLKESRTQVGGSEPVPDGVRDAGLPGIALIFHPLYQTDFALQCEGAADWNGTAAWVIHFQQFKGRPSRILAFQTTTGSVGAKLKGRAWIAEDSGQIVHVETNLIEGVGMLKLVSNSISIDYAPVQFTTQQVTLWLPRKTATYSDFGMRRTIMMHEYSNFKLFSVGTQSVIEKPKIPTEPPQKP